MTGPGGHDSEAMLGPSSDRTPTRDTTDGTSPDRFRITRRRALVGLTATTVASVGTGLGLAVLDDRTQRSETGEATECGMVATFVGGPNVRASPPLVVSRPTPGTSRSRRVRVIVENETAGPLALRFRRLEPDSETVDARPDGELAELLEIGVGIDGETLREGTFRTVFDGTGVRIDRRTRSGTAFWLSLDWRLPDGVTAGAVDDVIGSALRFRFATDDSTPNRPDEDRSIIRQ